MSKTRHLPADDARCGWIETLAPPPPARRLSGEISADCAVIGAGFTGLAAARRLAELRPGWRVVVLEAQRAGYGATGRASGFVVDLAGFIAAMPEESSRHFVRLSRAGIAELRRLVTAHAIDCDWDERGWLHVAAGDRGRRSLDGLHAWLEGLCEPFEWLDAAAMERLAGTPFYRAGLRLPGSVLVQSAALARALATALPPCVELYEQTPVVTIEPGRPYVVATIGGRLRAERLVLATNGYTPGLGFLRRKLFPLLTFGSFTRPLEPAEQASLGGERAWGLLAQDPMGSSVRRTVDQRLLIRNTICYRPDFRASERLYHQARANHRAALLRRYPQLAEVDFESTWAGVMGAVPSLYPFFGFLDERMVAAVGYTGAGIAMGTISGLLAAELVSGESSELLGERLRLPGPRQLPPEPFLGLGIRGKTAWMNASAGPTL